MPPLTVPVTFSPSCGGQVEHTGGGKDVGYSGHASHGGQGSGLHPATAVPITTEIAPIIGANLVNFAGNPAVDEFGIFKSLPISIK